MDRSPLDRNLPPHAVGAWRLHEQVATGGSSSIWRATGPDDEVVAVKLLDASANDTPAERRRFLRGFKVASMLSHPGIARLIEAGEHDGRLFVVEEFIDGETLAVRLRIGSMAIDEALHVMRNCGEILRYAHESGVVHRDLSPRNLMIDRTGRIVLVDFGIAVRPEGTTQPGTGSLLGTLPYLAPELICGRPATARSDLYALGAIAYQMFTGAPPFVASQPEALIRHHLRTKPASLRKLRPEIDPRLDRLVLRLLAKAPEDRSNNAEGFLSALDEATRTRRSTASGSAIRSRRPMAREARALHRLAVAPFTADLDDGSDPERMSRVALGLAETVAAGLAGIEGLVIVPPSLADGITRTSIVGRSDTVDADAVLSAHLVQRDGERRLAWTVTGRDGALLKGGRLGGPGATLFALEDSLLEALIRMVRGPAASARLPRMTAREEWYAPFLEALGCLRRTDDENSVDRAIALLEQIRDGGAGGVQVHAALGRAYLRRAEVRRDPEWRRSAEASCRIAISLDPLAPEAMVTMGRVLLSSGRPDDAVAILRRALEIEPAKTIAKTWLSRALESAGELDEADRLARECCLERSDLWFVHDRRAVLDFRRGRYREAAEGWRRVIELTPDNARAHSKLAASRFELGDLDSAEAAYRRSLEIRRTPLALAGLGSVLFYQGRRSEAIQWFRDAISLTPGDHRLWAWLGDVQKWVPGHQAESTESFDRAISVVQEELRANPADSRSWGELAVYLARREQHVEAARALERATQCAHVTTEVKISAVFVHELAGRRPEALRVLESISRDGPLSFELRADPELHDLRDSAEVQELLRLQIIENDAESNPSPGSVPSCKPKTIRSA